MQLTRDHTLVVHHDAYLGRTSNGTGFIGDCTQAELHTLDAGGWFSSVYATEKIPLLRDVLVLGKGRVRFEIELKATSRRFLTQVLAELVFCDVADAVELTSPHIPLLIEAAKIAPQLRLGMFFSPPPDWLGLAVAQQQVLDYLKLSGVQVAHLPLSMLEIGFVERLHAAGCLAHAANLNTGPDIERGIALQVDQFSTDHIDLALAKINPK